MDREMLERVIKGLECNLNFSERSDCEQCGYECRKAMFLSVPVNLLRDSLALLKAQEPRVDDKSQEVISGFTLYCPNCGFANTRWGNIPRENTVFYCGKCGMEVKRND